MKGIFVTGTDTGVGKTVVSALIVRGLRRRGIHAGVMKPIETGCAGDSEEALLADTTDGAILSPRDGLFLRRAAAVDDPIDLITPLRFALPLAPLVAAEREGRDVSLSRVRDAFAVLSAKYEFIVVEGAGGLLVPLAPGEPEGLTDSPYFVSDLARDLALPLIIVTRPVLGTLNHTLLTLRAAAQSGLKVTGIVINYSSPPSGDIAEQTNPAVLARLCGVPVLGTIPWLPDLSIESLDDLATRIDLSL